MWYLTCLIYFSVLDVYTPSTIKLQSNNESLTNATAYTDDFLSLCGGMKVQAWSLLLILHTRSSFIIRPDYILYYFVNIPHISEWLSFIIHNALFYLLNTSHLIKPNRMITTYYWHVVHSHVHVCIYNELDWRDRLKLKKATVITWLWEH